MKPFQRVFCLVPDCLVSKGYYRVLWSRHFEQGLRAVVPEVLVPEGVDYDWARFGGPQQWGQREVVSDRVRAQLLRARDAGGLDAVISYCFSRDIEPGLVREVIGWGIPWINFFCDSMHMFSQVEELARVVSLNWFPEVEAEARYSSLGVAGLCRPYALNPDHLPESGASPGSMRAGFIGFPSANRITQLGWIRVLGARVDIRGRGWVGPSDNPFYSAEPVAKRAWRSLFQRGILEKALRRMLWPLVKGQAGPELGDDEFFEYLRGSLVLLGLNQGRDEAGRFASYLKFRDVEFPGYGCCYLTGDNPDLPRAFEPGREILTYRSAAEAASWIRRLRREPGLAAAIGRAGRRRVLAKHTWRARVDDLCRAL